MQAQKTTRTVPFFRPDVGTAEGNSVASQIETGKLSACGKTQEFALEISKFIGADHTVCVDSNTASMELVLRAFGIGAGDEVITTPFTYSATADVIRNVGAKIVFCDLRKGSFEMDYNNLYDLINPNTKAIIPVDYGGVPCAYDKIRRILQDFHIRPSNEMQEAFGRPILLADAAHSFGATYKGHMIGTVADFTCFSFHAVKGITTGGEGGCITWKAHPELDNDALERLLWLLSDHGQTGKNIFNKHGLEWAYDIEVFGQNHIMTDVDAAFGIIQLRRFDGIMSKRTSVVRQYLRMLPNNVDVALKHFDNDYESVMHLLPIRIPDRKAIHRDILFGKMLDSGITCNVHYKPLPMFTAYKNIGFRIKDYPNAFDQFQNLITLPLYNDMTDDDIAYVCENLKTHVDYINELV